MVNFDKLRGALAEKRITQDSLALRLGCTRQSINNKINGRTPLTLRDVVVICEAIDATPEVRDSIFFE